MTKNPIIPTKHVFQLGNKIAKFGFICSLFLALNIAQAISIDDIVKSANNLWQEERKIKMPDFSLTDLNGNVHTNKSTQGKYLVVNFWATWCPPCLKEIPAFVEFYEKNKDKVLILGLDYEQADKAAIIEFTDTFMVNYPIILFDDKNGAQFTKFGEVLGMPTTYIYGPNGNLVDYQMGEMDMMALEKTISK
ncbi:thioredoxin [Isorropodon fossajaponicum endosymbiont JTNG4]|uniref:TlpA family protein disulfide reductase n=1 Tax=Isorropodon fossajaponicum symbiont TaxID=883811 RepID=UPI0019169967|nr:TlpA disulfide reductase family protein [Isorropodon fossajaponicum symbiont]BBB24336.1 thioredoxin [Isorropodon fossajaponicum endosymbiont JTNG4]